MLKASFRSPPIAADACPHKLCQLEVVNGQATGFQVCDPYYLNNTYCDFLTVAAILIIVSTERYLTMTATCIRQPKIVMIMFLPSIQVLRRIVTTALITTVMV